MSHSAASWIQQHSHHLTGSANDWDPLMERAARSDIILLGEATHGTHEFYAQRAQLTKQLIEKAGAKAIAIEGDWPDSYRVNRYVRGEENDLAAEESLRGFRRFPTWMWRNSDVLDLVSWMRDHNDAQRVPSHKVGFYGLDLYSLYSSIHAIIAYLETADPQAASRAKEHYSCFEPWQDQSQAYGRSVTLGVSEPCRREAVAQLVEIRRSVGEHLLGDGFVKEDQYIGLEENAKAVVDAEEYYRSMFTDPSGSWNLRDRHMAETMDHLLAHLKRHDPQAKLVVWAHNSHVGDSRATDMGQRGEMTLGRYARERHGGRAMLVGFSTYNGTVTAASDWDMPPRRREVRPALEGSMEDLLHQADIPSLMLLTGQNGRNGWLSKTQLQRAIGVVYRPETERQSHYLHAVPEHQFDVIVHTDQTRAVEPLERSGEWLEGEPPETYPTAI